MRRSLFALVAVSASLSLVGSSFADVVEIPVEKGKRDELQKHEIAVSVEGPDAEGWTTYTLKLDKSGSQAYAGSTLILKSEQKVLLSVDLQAHEDEAHIKRVVIDLDHSIARLATVEVFYGPTGHHPFDGAVYKVNLGSFAPTKEGVQESGRAGTEDQPEEP